ncbi:MAG: crossover junction endodeoxyribonuclease RuvC [bacterium]
MRIIGLDPGTASFGYGVIEKITPTQRGKNPLHMVTYGCIHTPSKTPLQNRLLTIYNELAEIIAKEKPNGLAIEKLYFVKNITTGIAVSQARGMALLLAAQNSLQFFEYDPTQIKLAVAGYGKADKQQVQKMVKLQLQLKEIPKPDDAADALAVALSSFILQNMH